MSDIDFSTIFEEDGTLNCNEMKKYFTNGDSYKKTNNEGQNLLHYVAQLIAKLKDAHEKNPEDKKIKDDLDYKVFVQNLLLSHKYSLDEADNSGKSARNYAGIPECDFSLIFDTDGTFDCLELKQYFQNEPAFGKKNNDGQTVLHYIAQTIPRLESGRSDGVVKDLEYKEFAMKTLIVRGYDPDEKDGLGKSANDYAKEVLTIINES